MRGQAPKPSLACPEPQATFSRDPAAMEETHANVTSTHWERGTSETSIQKSENIVLNRVCDPFLALKVKEKKLHAVPLPPPPLFSFICRLYMLVIVVFSSRKINHCGALLRALTLRLHVQDLLYFPISQDQQKVQSFWNDVFNPGPVRYDMFTYIMIIFSTLKN
jgi:hypothetical protein